MSFSLPPKNVLAAIVGQPNSGKSTIFHLLTRIHREVGNYPGMTVDAKSGHYHENGFRIELVDLPGTYSFSAGTPEERIARNFLLSDRPEVVLDVMDASNFRRHLFLLLELLEMQTQVVVCLNFLDVARRRGVEFDLERLKARCAAPVVGVVAVKGENLAELRREILAVAAEDRHEPNGWRVDYGPKLEPVLARVEAAVRTKEHLSQDFSPRWLAVKLLENDRETRRLVEHHTHGDDWGELLDFCDEELNLFIGREKLSPKTLILQTRHRLAADIERETLRRVKPRTAHFSDRIDAVVCHPIAGPVTLFLLLVLTFWLSFRLADGWRWVPFFADGRFAPTTPVEFIGYLFHHTFPAWLDRLFGLSDGPLRSLLHEGVLAGMGGVIQFVPVIFIMFSLLAMLEQSGYIARVAMIMDRFMRRFNLQGQSILPMVLGGGLSGGCAVPAIMTTRSITNRRQRLLTVLAIPMLNCGGKIPVYAMLIGAFFSQYQGLVMAGLICCSWGIALLSAQLLGKTVVRGINPPLLLELPAYQIPRMADVAANAGRQSGEFLKKAGTIILAANIILWLLMTYPQGPAKTIEGTTDAASANESLEHSYAAMIGQKLEPVSRLAGFDWKDNVALMGGMATKELIVSSMATLYRPEAEVLSVRPNVGIQSEPEKNHSIQLSNPAEPDSLKKRLAHSHDWSSGKALAMLVFIMLYAPCSGTLVAMRRVTDSWKWPLFSMIFNTALGFALAVAVWQCFG